MLLKFKYFVKFLQQHGQEVFPEVRTAYVETLSRIYRSALCACPVAHRWRRCSHFLNAHVPVSCRAAKYVIALNQLQVDVTGKQDLLGAHAP